MDIGEWSVILRTIMDDIPGLEDSGVILFCDPDHREGLAILQCEIESGCPPLDEVILQDQGFIFVACDDELYPRDVLYKDPRLQVSSSREIGKDPFPQIPGFPHVYDRIGAIVHEIDSGFMREGPNGSDDGGQMVGWCHIPSLMILR